MLLYSAVFLVVAVILKDFRAFGFQEERRQITVSNYSNSTHINE